MARHWLVVLLLPWLACGRPAVESPRAGGAPILRVVPHDTPYVLATLEPLPRGYLDSFLAAQKQHYRDTLKLLEPMQTLGAGPRLLYTMVRELEPYYSADGLDRLGIGHSGTTVLYGIGIFPALRLELAAPDRLAAFLRATIAKSGVAVAEETMGAHRYWVWRAEGMAVAWAVDGGALLATIAPASRLGQVLPALFGDALPPRSLRDTGALAELVRTYGLFPSAVGYVDTRRLVTVAAELFQLDPICAKELAALAADAPRLVMGAEELGAGHDRFAFTLELQPRLAGMLAALRAPAAGVGGPLGNAVARVGLAVDVQKAIGLAKLWASALALSPYRCPLLADINGAASSLRSDLDGPIPEWATALRGASLIIYDPDVSQLRAVGTLTAVDPLQVVGYLQTLLPSLGAVSIPPDGTPVRVAALAPFDHVAVRGNVLGVSAGAGMEAELQRTLAAPLPAAPPLFHVAIDADRARRLLATLGDDLDMTGRWEFSLSVSERGVTLRGGQQW